MWDLRFSAITWVGLTMLPLESCPRCPNPFLGVCPWIKCAKNCRRPINRSASFDMVSQFSLKSLKSSINIPFVLVQE